MDQPFVRPDKTTLKVPVPTWGQVRKMAEKLLAELGGPQGAALRLTYDDFYVLGFLVSLHDDIADGHLFAPIPTGAIADACNKGLSPREEEALQKQSEIFKKHLKPHRRKRDR